MTEELGLDISMAKISMLDDKGSGESIKTLEGSGETVLCKMKFYVYQILIDKNADYIVVKPGDDIEKTVWVEYGELNMYKLTSFHRTL